MNHYSESIYYSISIYTEIVLLTSVILPQDSIAGDLFSKNG